LARLVVEKCVNFTPVGRSKAMVDRGYRGEMEAFAVAVRNRGTVRCDGRVALADAVMALTAVVAMRSGRKIKFDPAWYDPASDAVPEPTKASAVAGA
jgi:hypothetical protein